MFGDDYIYSGPMRELFSERKQRKRIKTLCSKLYWENENAKKMNEPKLTNGIRCSSFQTDLETIGSYGYNGLSGMNDYIGLEVSRELC